MDIWTEGNLLPVEHRATIRALSISQAPSIICIGGSLSMLARSFVRFAKKVLPIAVYPSSLLRMMTTAHTHQIIGAGPFRGVRFTDRAVWGAYTPKLLGTYEREIAPAIEEVIQSSPSHLVDIGGAEGYYAVGLLHRLPDAQLTVFESLDEGRALIHDLAKENGVLDRLEIADRCTADALQACLARTHASALLCDVEGAELDILDPQRVPSLREVTMIVEVHDAKRPGCTTTMIQRFGSTHHIQRIGQEPRSATEYQYRDPISLLFPSLVVKYALNEFRSKGNGWVYMQPKTVMTPNAPALPR